MAHARQQHPNAVLTRTGPARVVACVIDNGWSIDAPSSSQSTGRFVVRWIASVRHSRLHLGREYETLIWRLLFDRRPRWGTVLSRGP